MNMTTQCAPESLSLTIVCDERCTVVRSLAALLRVCAPEVIREAAAGSGTTAVVSLLSIANHRAP